MGRKRCPIEWIMIPNTDLSVINTIEYSQQRLLIFATGMLEASYKPFSEVSNHNIKHSLSYSTRCLDMIKKYQNHSNYSS